MDVVVAAALFRGPQVLLCHRPESARAALVRELREELAVHVPTDAVPAQPNRLLVLPEVRMSVWRIDSWVGEVVNAAQDEHDEIAWFGVADAMKLRLAHPAYPEMLQALSALPDSR